ncbi:MAG: hypothetical protein KGI59_02415, partial [Patescibacteria group bacterium]|nr:hypothetical protein [Patescibacteria group bacterium]
MSVAKDTKANTRLILLDAHAILHRAYHALPDFSTSKGEPTGALYGLSSMLLKIIEDLKPDYIAACYDLKGPTYRHEIYKEYKAGRKAADEALVAQMISSRKIFEAMDIPIYDKEGFEADDMLGTIVEQVKSQKSKIKSTDIIIASGDMDTLQLVDDKKVQVYTLKKGIKDTIMYDEKGVIERYGFGPALIPDYKGLRGDPSDNIIGVKGIGEKTATILIQQFGSIENMYKELEAGREAKFKKAGISPRIVQLLKDNKEEAEFSKMLATIRRDAPITFAFPEKTFRDTIDPKKINALWTSLEFRTLPQRLKQVMENWDGKKPESQKSKVKSQTSPASRSTSPEELASEGDHTVDPDELEKVGTALWLIQSNLTNPKIEDILNFTGKETFEEARPIIMDGLKQHNVEKVYMDIELPLMPITHEMEKRGVKIDRQELARLSKNYHVELDRLEKSIHT